MIMQTSFGNMFCTEVVRTDKASNPDVHKQIKTEKRQTALNPFCLEYENKFICFLAFDVYERSQYGSSILACDYC